MTAKIQHHNTMNTVSSQAVDARRVATDWTPNPSVRNVTSSDAICAAASKSVESKMSDFEFHNGRLAPNTNDLSAIARRKFVEGTV